MSPLSRKEFLRLAAAGTLAGASAVALNACGVKEAATGASVTASPLASPSQTAAPTETAAPPTKTPAATATPAPTATFEPTATATPEPGPDLVVAHNGEPEELVRRAIAAMGGMEQFVFKGANVIVKPNICVDFRTYEWAATTNPWVVGTLVRMAFEAGAASVRVMDQTWQRNMTEAYARSGIQEQVEAAGGVMEWMPLDKFVNTPVPQGVELKEIGIYDEILKADVVINVPIAKHHESAKLTLGMKNLMGIISNRPAMHDSDVTTFGTIFGHRIADLVSVVRPTLNVMDAVRVMMDGGPTGFSLKQVKKADTIIVSRDIVALDSYTTGLFEMKPEDLPYVTVATERGLGRSDLATLRIEEFNVR
ncbi:MAG: DUF362 domain-containing protein [Chloroflexota bacterium]